MRDRLAKELKELEGRINVAKSEDDFDRIKKRMCELLDQIRDGGDAELQSRDTAER